MWVAAAALTQKVDEAEAALSQCWLPGRKKKKQTKTAKPSNEKKGKKIMEKKKEGKLNENGFVL